jgi:5'-3' exonuclease
MKKILLIDENNILFRTLDIHRGLLFGKKRTGGIYGFVALLTKYINLHKPNYIMVCGDTPPLIRRQEYAGYKASRKKLDQEYFSYIVESRGYVEKFLNEMGIQRWQVQGYESDDLIAGICHKHWDNEIVICSNDDDLFQVLNSTTVIQRSKDIYSEKDFENDYNINTCEWAIVKAMSGNHNDVKPLYKGLGIKTAIKILKDKLKWDTILNAHLESFWNNYYLVELPHKTFKEEWIPELTPRTLVTDRDLDNALTKDYGIQVTTQMYQAYTGE